MNPEEYIRRMNTAISVFTAALKEPYFRFILSDDLNNAAKQIDRIVSGSKDDTDQQNYRKLVKSLMDKTEELLAQAKLT